MVRNRTRYVYIYIYIYTRSSDVQVRTEFFEIYPSTLLLLTFPLDNNRNSLLLKSSSILTGKIINLFTSLPGILFFYLFWTNCNVRQLKARVVNFEFEILYRAINNIFITYFELSFHGSSIWQKRLIDLHGIVLLEYQKHLNSDRFRNLLFVSPHLA